MSRRRCRAINSVDPLLPVSDVRSMTAVQAAAISQQRLLMTLVVVLAVAAVCLPRSAFTA